MKNPVLIFIMLLFYNAATAQNWTGSYVMHIDNVSRKQPVDLKFTIKGNKTCMEIMAGEKAGKVRTIYDTKNNTMTFLTEKDGSGKFGMVRPMVEYNLTESDSKNAKITATGETKKIDSYTSAKMIAESDESTTEMWVTEETGLTYQDVLALVNKGKGPASNYAYNMKNYKDLKGVPLEMTITSKKNPGDITIVKIMNIVKGKTDDRVFSTEGYQVMDMTNVRQEGK